MKKILYVVPHITSYLLPLFVGISEHCDLDIIFSSIDEKEGFGDLQYPQIDNINWIKVKTIKFFGKKKFGFFQTGIVRSIIKRKPDIVIIGANPNYLSLWVVLLVGMVLGVPVYCRGQGAIKKSKKNIFYGFLISIILASSKKYLCYTPSVKDSLLPYTRNPEKLIVDFNTRYNEYPVYPEEKTGNENGVLFIGRLRSGSGIETLIDTIKMIREEKINIELHIIGSGSQAYLLEEMIKGLSWVHQYGMLYDDQKINQISRSCRVGCIAGDAGLGIVHMMSLSLPPITHGEMSKHAGPEPSYIIDGINGWIYNPRLDKAVLADVLKRVFLYKQKEMLVYQEQAFKTYRDLSTPPFHERILRILNTL